MRRRRWKTLCCIAAYAAGLAIATPAVTRAGDPASPEDAPGEPALPPPSWLRNASDPVATAPSRSYTFGIIGSAAGLVAGVGLAVWVKRQADDRYAEYEITADPDRASELFSSAERYDRATIIGWGLAQVSFVALLYFLTREQPRTLVPVEGEPLVRTRGDGVELGFRFTP